MFLCPKSERIDQAKQLLLCYSAGGSQAVHSAAGLWGEVLILSRNMHRKAKSLHIAQQEKHSTIRGHHCCMQREAEYLLQLKNWMFAVPCGEWVLTVVSILLSVPMACTALAKTSSKLCLGSTWASALGLSRDY